MFICFVFSDIGIVEFVFIDADFAVVVDIILIVVM